MNNSAPTASFDSTMAYKANMDPVQFYTRDNSLSLPKKSAILVAALTNSSTLILDLQAPSIQLLELIQHSDSPPPTSLPTPPTTTSSS